MDIHSQIKHILWTFWLFLQAQVYLHQEFWAGQTGRLKRQAVPPPLYSEFIPCVLQHTAEPKQKNETLCQIRHFVISFQTMMVFANRTHLLWRSELRWCHVVQASVLE